MTVKVFTKKIVPRKKALQVIPLFRQLRALAMNQKGFLSCETLRNLENPGEFIVISTWSSSKDFKNWLGIKEREAIQDKMDGALDGKTDYQIFYYGFTE